MYVSIFTVNTMLKRNMFADGRIGIQYEDMAYTAGLGFATVGANNVRRQLLSTPDFILSEYLRAITGRLVVPFITTPKS